MTTRTYTELMKLNGLEERFEYLAVHGYVGDQTFGSDRWLNQHFYRSTQWKRIRDHVIVRDDNCDLGVRDFPIAGRPLIHHMNPMAPSDLIDFNPDVLDPEFLITTQLRTHNAIHFGTVEHLPRPYVPRTPGDTQLWQPIDETMGDPDENERGGGPRRSRAELQHPRVLSDGDTYLARRALRRRSRPRWLR